MGGFDALKQNIAEALVTAGFETAIMGLDISFNEHEAGDFEPHWSLHYRGHAPRAVAASTMRKFQKHFPKGDLIRKPIWVTTWDGDLRAIAYSMKATFERRQSYIRTKSTPKGERSFRDTRGRPLRGTEAVELAVFLDGIGLRQRLVLIGTRLAYNTHGKVIIMATRR